MAEWITTDNLREALGIDPSDTYDSLWLGQTVDAVNVMVSRWRSDLEAGFASAAFAKTFASVNSYPDIQRGATELAVKMYRSRGATDDGSGSYDVYAYAARYLDANVSMLLGLDRPVVA